MFVLEPPWKREGEQNVKKRASRVAARKKKSK